MEKENELNSKRYLRSAFFISFTDKLTLSCIYSKSIVVDLDMESKIMKTQYKNEKYGLLHYEANISYNKTGHHSRTYVVFNPKHNLKLIPR